MKFLSLSVENFGSFESVRNFPLADRGLVLVQGDNQSSTTASSNGAGKSTLFEALSWALYGATAKGISGDTVVRKGSKGGCAVTVILDDDGTVYEITRYRKHKTGKNDVRISANGKDITLGTATLTQERLTQIIGCSYEVFVAAVYAGQEKIPDLPAMTDKQLKVLVEEAAGVQVLEAAYALANKRFRDAENELLDAEREVDYKQRNVTVIEDLLTQAIQSRDGWGDLVAASVAKIKCEANKKALEFKALKDKLASGRTLNQIDEELAALSAQETLLTSEKQKLQQLETDWQNIARQHAQKRAVLDLKIDRAKKIKTHLDQAKLNGPGACGECGRQHGEETHRRHVETLAESLRDALKEVQQIKTELDALSNAQGSAQSAVDAFKQSMTDSTRLASLRASLTISRAAVERNLADCQKAASDYRDLKNKIETDLSAPNPYDQKVADLSNNLPLEKSKLTDALNDRDSKQKALDTAKMVSEVFSPKGVRAHILDTVTPYLNARTAHYLGALADGKITAVWTTLTTTAKGELREKFSIAVENSDGVEGFAALSGGEKRRVRLACAMALQDLVATRAAKPIELFIADEVDAALDEQGLERLMTVLEQKARERGSVFVISHNSLKDWCRTIITVEKRGGVSYLL